MRHLGRRVLEVTGRSRPSSRPASEVLNHPLAAALLIFIPASFDKGLPLGQREMDQPCYLVRTGRDGLGLAHARSHPVLMRTQMKGRPKDPKMIIDLPDWDLAAQPAPDNENNQRAILKTSGPPSHMPSDSTSRL